MIEKGGRIYKQKYHTRSLFYIIEECCIHSNQYGWGISTHMPKSINIILFIELLHRTNHERIFQKLFNILESYVKHTCITHTQ